MSVNDDKKSRFKRLLETALKVSTRVSKHYYSYGFKNIKNRWNITLLRVAYSYHEIKKYRYA